MTTTSRASVLLLILAAFVAGLVIGALSMSPAKSTSDAPDWTVAKCSLWTNNATPNLPPFTVPSVCAFQDVSGNWTLSMVTDLGVK